MSIAFATSTGEFPVYRNSAARKTATHAILDSGSFDMVETVATGFAANEIAMTDYATLTDEQLVTRIRAQDQEALAQLYARYGTPAFSLAMRTLQNTPLAEEAVQDAFMKVWRNPAAWDSRKGKFSSWLLTVTRYTAIDLLRSEKRQATTNADSIEDVQIASDLGRPDDPLLRDGRLLRSLIEQLPPEQSQVVMLGFFYGYTHSDLAEKLNLPLGTVKTRVRLGLKKLRGMWITADSGDINP